MRDNKIQRENRFSFSISPYGRLDDDDEMCQIE